MGTMPDNNLELNKQQLLIVFISPLPTIMPITTSTGKSIIICQSLPILWLYTHQDHHGHVQHLHHSNHKFFTATTIYSIIRIVTIHLHSDISIAGSV